MLELTWGNSDDLVYADDILHCEDLLDLKERRVLAWFL